MKQELTIPNWFPAWNPNGTGNRSHWATLRKRKQADEVMAWASATQAGWQKINGRARLTITFVYPRRVRVDTDNLFARCKGLIDGLRVFMVDDSAEWLELTVRAEVEKGTKAIRMTLEDALSTAA